MTNRFPGRLVTVLVAAAQLVAPGAAAIADGLVARDSAKVPAVHVESEGSPCVATHPPDCGLCRHLTTSAVRAAGTQLGELFEVHAEIERQPAHAHAQTSLDPSRARAPPFHS